ncbi:uncharacterized protein V6R79_000009 [Siganus canaliculatus]
MNHLKATFQKLHVTKSFSKVLLLFQKDEDQLSHLRADEVVAANHTMLGPSQACVESITGDKRTQLSGLISARLAGCLNLLTLAFSIRLMTFCCYSNNDQAAVVAKLFRKTCMRLLVVQLTPESLSGESFSDIKCYDFHSCLIHERRSTQSKPEKGRKSELKDESLCRKAACKGNTGECGSFDHSVMESELSSLKVGVTKHEISSTAS